MPRTQRYTTQQILEAVQASSGSIYKAAAWLRCSAQTIRNYANGCPEIRTALDRAYDIDPNKPPQGPFVKHRKYREISVAKRWAIWERDNFTCQRCGVRRFLGVDHIIPVGQGGTNDDDNLQTLCLRCNTLKGEQVIDYRRKG